MLEWFLRPNMFQPPRRGRTGPKREAMWPAATASENEFDSPGLEWLDGMGIRQPWWSLERPRKHRLVGPWDPYMADFYGFIYRGDPRYLTQMLLQV